MSHEPPDPFQELQLETLRQRDEEIKRLREVLKGLYEPLENIRYHYPCPDPADGGCIPSAACAYEQARIAIRRIERALVAT